ncbi:MAG: nucleotidyltransferase domain-containing protein [Betaproteobacteria bacterium]|nr:nucleotidyltransferase domain-containing protein [Betaproteobacteria bacterium]
MEEARTSRIAAGIEAARVRLVGALHPEKIILFGSHVWGTPTPDSDLDFLVIVEDSDQPPHKRAQAAYRSLLGLGVPCDVLVQTRAETERLSKVATSLTRRVLEQGRVIHG